MLLPLLCPNTILDAFSPPCLEDVGQKPAWKCHSRSGGLTTGLQQFLGRMQFHPLLNRDRNGKSLPLDLLTLYFP